LGSNLQIIVPEKPNYCPTLIKYLKNEEYADVTLQVGDSQKLKAHSFILKGK
jgi:hypothetical protein